MIYRINWDLEGIAKDLLDVAGWKPDALIDPELVFRIRLASHLDDMGEFPSKSGIGFVVGGNYDSLLVSPNMAYDNEEIIRLDGRKPTKRTLVQGKFSRQSVND